MVEKSTNKTKNKSTTNNDGLIWTLIKLLLNQSYFLIAISVFIALVPLKDFPFNAKSFNHPDYEKALSTVLQKPQLAKLTFKLDDTQLTRKLIIGPGPEALVYSKELNSFFTGLADGRIMRIDDKLTKAELFTRLSANATADLCDDNIHRSEICGRPLGLEVHDGKLFVIDAVFGLYSIDLKTKKSFQIPITAYLANVLDKELNYLYNDIAFDPVRPDLCYITVSTTNYKMNQLPFGILEHENSGLLLTVDLKNKNGSVLAKEMLFTNGNEISSDKQFLYVVESTAYSVSKLNLKQLRDSIYLGKGELPKLEPFLVDLPGEPDNIHTSNGKIYVSFAMIRLNGRVASDYLAQLPVIRNFIAKSLYLISRVVHFVNKIILENQFNYKSEYLNVLEFKFFSGHIVYSAINAKGGIAVYDEKTKQLVEVIASNEFGFISMAYVHNKYLLFGSFKNDFIGVTKS